MSKEGAVVHFFSKRDIEPDYSGYVDEYRFIPLTPSLEDALEKMVGGSLGDIRDAVELERLGYIDGLERIIGSAVRYDVTPKGRRYADEAAAYRERRDRWVAARSEEAAAAERSRFARDAAIAIVSAVLGAVASMALR